ncbi:transporter substrate-binding domain-containing protein [Marispirochaeta aestuarii]|uniref:substrate-binding periplasmic protein n=1 Tax=Marispirochaeta aestuarii TaxID=1963862 RepID=UPI0029C99808|nr:transporter substrate-binding domain-containing protein [Marispirochaeta aestuarii]
MLFKIILIASIFLFAFQLLAQQQTIRIATLEYPPFIYSDGNQVKGPIVEKVKDVFSRLGVAVIIYIFPITRGLLMVNDGDVDAYFSLKRTPERERDLLFTNEPLIRQSFVFFVKKESKIEWDGNIETIKDYKIGVVSNTSYGNIFDGYLENSIIVNTDTAQSFELNFKKLIAGRIDLVINSYDVGKYLLEKLNAENDVIALFPPVEIINSYLAFTRTKDHTELARQYDYILANEND